MNIKIVVATHKQYQMPDRECYLPVQVGKEGKPDLGFVGDDSGDNISEKNPYYCELTGLYWAWKNLAADVLGLVHYRRYFGRKSIIPHWIGRKKSPMQYVLVQTDIEKLMEKSEIIVPKKRRYFIETLYSHYAHTHDARHLDMAREVLQEGFPGYVDAFDRVMERTKGHMFNMFIMNRRRCNEYCSFLFPVLEELEKRIDVSNLDNFQARVFGRISEMMLDVWLERNQYRYIEVPVIYTETIKWPDKIKSFLYAKLVGRKYTRSF